MPILLFDFDGTLADTTALILRCFHATLESELQTSLPDEDYIATFGIPLRVALRGFFLRLVEEGRAAPGDPEQRADQLAAAYRAHHERWHDEMIRSFPGVLEEVQAAHQAGARLALVTSKKRPSATRGLSHLGLAPLFPVLVCGEETPNHKPHPEPVLRALSLLGAEAHEAVMIGDSPHDIEAAKAAGARAVGVLWGPFSRAQLEAARPDHLLTHPAELRSLWT